VIRLPSCVVTRDHDGRRRDDLESQSRAVRPGPLGLARGAGTLGCVAFERITVDPNKVGGIPVIRDLRMRVPTVVAMVDGLTVETILSDFPDCQPDDIRAALHFAAV